MRDTSRRIRRMRREKAAKAYRRTVLTRLAILLSVLAVITTAGVSALTTAFAQGAAEYEVVIAQKGDTLWDIAAKHNYADRDVRAVVDKIMRANDMHSADIRVGDRINIPIN